MVSDVWTLAGLNAIFFGEPDTIFPDHVGETQKAPSRIAPTKTNAAHTATMLSFIAMSTRRTSITVLLNQTYQKAASERSETIAALPHKLCRTHLPVELQQPHEI